jgi:DNA adenine methylase
MLLKWPGSKLMLADWIISHFPDNYKEMTYFEGFFGSGSVFFRKERSVVETINDMDSDIFNLFLQIRENKDTLIYYIKNTPWSRDEYKLSFLPADNNVEKARRFLVKMWFSIGGHCRNSSVTMSMNIKGHNGNHTAFVTDLPSIIESCCNRLLNIKGSEVQIENRNALDLISKYNRSNVLMYLDPPYLPSTRRRKKIYNHEMSASDHKILLELVTHSNAMIIISGYENDLYDVYLSDWKTDRKIAIDEGGNRRIECIWYNYTCRQYYLFS